MHFAKKDSGWNRDVLEPARLRWQKEHRYTAGKNGKISKSEMKQQKPGQASQDIKALELYLGNMRANYTLSDAQRATIVELETIDDAEFL